VIVAPLTNSEEAGVYSVIPEVVLVNVPDPFSDHVKLDDAPEIDPDSLITSPEQTTMSVPAFAEATEFIMTTTSSVTCEHGPVGSSVVRMKVIEPLFMSDKEGSYLTALPRI
jgi:hypothetical protein